jgi:hypothetical protein
VIGAVAAVALGAVLATTVGGGKGSTPPAKTAATAPVAPVSPAAAVAPATVAAPAAPATVTIKVASSPVGAEVFHGEVSVGKAPVKLELPVSDEAVELVLKLEGHEERRSEIVPNKNRDVSWNLKPLPAAAVATPVAPTAGRPRSTTGRSSRTAKPREAPPARPADRGPKGVGNNTLEPDF